MPRHSCRRKGCTEIRSEFSLFLNRRRPPKYDGYTFCSDTCLYMYLESELGDKWRYMQQDKQGKIPRPKLGSILLQSSTITRDQLDAALRLQLENGRGRIGEWLQQLGFVEEHQITHAIAKQYGLPLINLKNCVPRMDAIKLIPGKVAKYAGLLPVGFDDDQNYLRIAVSGPVNFGVQEAIRQMVRKGFLTYIGDPTEIQFLIEEWYGPDELDLSNIPTFDGLRDLLEIGRDVAATAVNQRATDFQVALLDGFLWVRMEFDDDFEDQMYRCASDPLRLKRTTQVPHLAVASALAT